MNEQRESLSKAPFVVIVFCALIIAATLLQRRFLDSWAKDVSPGVPSKALLREHIHDAPEHGRSYNDVVQQRGATVPRTRRSSAKSEGSSLVDGGAIKGSSGDMPTRSEQSGLLGGLYALWSAGTRDDTETKSAQEYFAREFEVHGVAAMEQDISCTTELCRAQFVFSDRLSLRSLEKLQPGATREYVVADPRVDDNEASITIYLGLDDGIPLPTVPLPVPKVVEQRRPQR